MKNNLVTKIAITGNIASGKSQVEKYLISKGYSVYDADIFAHDALDKLSEFYGYDVFTEGKIDRTKLGKLVFSDKDVKNKLEEIIHPKVKGRILEVFEQHKNDKYVFISVPLLFETGFEKLFDKVLLISVPEEEQLARLMKRNNLSKNDALKRIKSQIPQDKKISLADYVIENNSDINKLIEKIDKFLNWLV